MAGNLEDGTEIRQFAHDAELSVLGSIVLANNAFHVVDALIGWQDFADPRHRLIYEVISLLTHRGEAVDVITIATELDKKGTLTSAGGVDYLTAIDQAVGSSINVEAHAKLVKRASTARKLSTALKGTLEKVDSGNYAALEDVQSGIVDQVLALSDASAELVPFREILASVIERYAKARESPGVMLGLSSGMSALDHLTHGFQGGHMIVIAGRPAMGKTALMLDLMVNAAQTSGKTAACFSLEMTKEQLVGRILASASRVPASHCSAGMITDGDIDRLLMANKRIMGIPLVIDDKGAIPVAHIRSLCQRIVSDPKTPPLGAIFVDYLQLMTGAGHGREQVVAAISAQLKTLAKDLDVPVIVLAQLNRGVDARANKRPILSDLRESGAIEQDADIIIFVYRDEVYDENTEDKGTAELIVGKNRHGATGTAKVRFTKHCTRFESLRDDY